MHDRNEHGRSLLSRAEGLFLGLFNKRPVWDDSNKHTLLIHPGKALGFILPTILANSGSMVIHDPLGELWALTAKRRQAAGHRVLRLCFDGNPDTELFDPLSTISVGTPYEVAHAQNVAKLLCDPQGLGLDTGSASDHWRKSAYAFLTACILHILHSAEIPQEKKNLSGLREYLANPLKSTTKILNEMLTHEHDPDLKHGWSTFTGEPSKTHPVVMHASRDMLDRPEGERGSILSSVKSYLEYYHDTAIGHLTSKSTFTLDEIMNGSQPTTLYLITNPATYEEVLPALRLVLNLLITDAAPPMQFNDDGEAQKPHKHDLMMLLDNVAAAAARTTLANALPFISAYGVRTVLRFGSIPDLFETFTKKDAVLHNCTIIAFGKTRDTKTADFAAKLAPKHVKSSALLNMSGDKAIVFLANSDPLFVDVPDLTDILDNATLWTSTDNTTLDATTQEIERNPLRYDGITADRLVITTPYGDLRAVNYIDAQDDERGETVLDFEGLLAIDEQLYLAGLTCVQNKYGAWSVLHYNDGPTASPFALYIIKATRTARKPLDQSVILDHSKELSGVAFTAVCNELREAMRTPNGLEWYALDYARLQNTETRSA